MYNPNIYTVGGTVQAGGGIYISRQADEELLALCRQRIFAYVLTPRQMGKSSLMVRTAERLTEEDIQSVIIDLTQLGVQVTAEQWYLGLLTIIEGTLMLDTDVVQWWQARAHLGFTQRLTQFFQEVLLAEVASPIVIFVDEIDTTLSLDFTDDFFAAIRSFYNARSYKPEFRRLSFVLIGVATPGDLIGDSKRTPFNIGQRVDLTDFTFKEAKPLAEGLGLPNNAAQQVLRRVLTWTGGHPYLSQRLCSKIREQGKSSWSQADVERLVSSTFFGAMSEQDNNLQFVRDMLTKRAPDLFGVLTTYRDIRRGKRAIVDEEQSLVKSHLKLSGVVRRENGVLQVRNQIYNQVFDEKWIKECLPITWKRSTLQRVLSILQRVLFISLYVAVLIVVIRELGYLQLWELSAYDHVMRSRLPEQQDERILLVTVTDDDIRAQPANELRGGSLLSDKTLALVVNKLQQFRPQVIGLNNISPDYPASDGYLAGNLLENLVDNLAQTMKKSDPFFPICKTSKEDNYRRVRPPEKVIVQRQYFSDVLIVQRQSFSDILVDTDGVIRRQCLTDKSFSFLLASRYLASSKKRSQLNSKQNLQFRDVVFKNLEENSRDYDKTDNSGYQVLLNWRATDQIAREVTLKEVLEGRLNGPLVQGRIVIIGITGENYSKHWSTPYSSQGLTYKLMSDTVVQAHMVSQILSAMLDDRPLLSVWSKWGEVLWVWYWSIGGGMIAWYFRSPLHLGIAITCGFAILYGVCLYVLIQGVWIPLVPSALVFFVASSVVAQVKSYR